MSWRDLFKPQDKDPKNIVEWLGLITDDIKKLKNTDNWYDEVNLLTDRSIIDNLDTNVGDFALSARQGYLLNQKIGVSDQNISVLKEEVSQLQLDIIEANKKITEIKDTDIRLINETISTINETLTSHGQTLEAHGISIEQNKTDIEGLGTRVTKNESDISLLDGRVTENELEITSLGERVTKNETDIVNINSNIDIIEEDITDIRNEISQNIEIGNTRIDSLVGTNVKISGLDVTINSTNTQLTISPGKAIIEGKIVEVKEAIVKDIDPLLLSEDNLLYTLISLEEETNNIVVSLSESDMDSKSLRIHTMIINNGSIIESTNNSNMVPISSIVGISADSEAANIREQIPSGFTVLSDLDFEYMRNNENQIKFKSKSVAYVNGYKIEIPAGTIVNIDRAPEKDSRDDLLFLEAWKDIDFPKTGQLKWRIRYVNGVNFNILQKGLTTEANRYHYNNGKVYGIPPQAGNEKPIEINNASGLGRVSTLYSGYSETKDTKTYPQWLNIEDMGLYYAGYGKGYENITKTLDGYCYAIPMFRLYRKPSCGKLEPYEFDKINKLCDYEKVKSLVTSEKVERVINETIYGNTLTNYCTPMKSIGTSGIASITTEIGENSFKITTTSAGSSVLLTQVLSTLSTNTTYTIILDVEQMTSEYIQIGDRINSGLFGNNYVPSTNLGFGRNKIKFTTGTDLTDYGIWIGRTDSLASGSIIHIKNLMILEGDWTGFNYVPEYFSGLSSLGESEYNLIKVKNGIIDKTTYNPISGNQKLKALPAVSHIKSENLIIPEIVAEVKRGEDKLSDLTEFSKLETTGDETIEFTNIKGRTLQNLSSVKSANISNSTNIVSGMSTGITIPPTQTILKADTTYTLIFTLVSTSLDKGLKLSLRNGDTVIYPGVTFNNGAGIYRRTFSHTTQLTSIRIYTDNTTTGYATIDNVMILEGDWTETPIEKLPYVDGIKSVGESENNIILLSNYNDYLVDNNWYPIMSSSGAAVTVKPNILEDYSTNKYASIFAELEPGDYVISSSDYLYLNRESRNGTLKQLASISLPYKFTVDYKQLVGFSIERAANATDPTDIYIENNLPKDFKIKIEKGTTPTEYNEDKQKIYLKEPLRSLPNGVCDEIIGNKITRRIGKLVLNGSEDLNLLATTTGWTTDSEVLAVDYMNIPNLKKGSTIIHDSDLVSLTNASGRMGNTHYIATWSGGNNIVIGILRSKLSSQDLAGCKTWLSQNPITLYYELTNPIVEYLEYGYDKESIKTYQLDAPLRSLPNGVKDEIKDGYLFRRCGEIILDGTNGSISEWGRADTNTFSFLIKLSNDINNKLGSWMDGIQKISKSDKFICYNGRELQVNDKEGISIWNVKNNINIKILKSRLSSESITGVKEWLQNNPIKIIYELLTPQIIKLNETHITNPDYSLNRQFKDTNWLRVLPNGVKDTVENGKVIRRVGKIVLNGSETYHLIQVMTNDTTALFYNQNLKTLAKLNGGENGNVLSDIFIQLPGYDVYYNYCTKTPTFYISNTNNLYFRISKTSLSSVTVDGFKTWLSKNLVTVYYELATPTEEPLDNTNYTYYPCHDSFNTSCSSLYVTDGYNKIDVLNNVKSSDNIIETSYRVIENNSEIEDAHYKPSVNGKELSYVIPKGKNKINMFDYTLNESSNKCIVYRNENKLVVSTVESSKWAFPIRWYIRLKPNSSYTISANVESEYLTNYLIRVYSYSEDTIISASNSTTNLLKTINSITTTTSFKTDDNGGILVAFLIASDTNTNTYAPNIPFSISNLQIEEGTAKTDYEEFIPDVRAFENIDSNDVKDMRNLVSLTGYNYEQLLNKSFDLLLKGEI